MKLRRTRRVQAGYNLVMLMVLLTILNIVIAASLPSWSSVIRRDREEELISRGLQYAEAIRIFQNRFQRPPVRLEELIDVEPRSIRRLWKDPMTDSGKWRLIPLQGPSQPLTPQPPGEEGEVDPEGRMGGLQGEEGEGEEGEETFGKPKQEVQIGPFKGVHSRSGKTSIMIFNGKERYDEWHFTVELLAGGGPMPPPEQGIAPPPTGGGGGGNPLRSRWIGRPIPEILQPAQPTGLDENDPMGNGGFDNNGRNGRKPRTNPGDQ
jgi:type II secretory pathway pseudopilin PulG